MLSKLSSYHHIFINIILLQYQLSYIATAWLINHYNHKTSNHNKLDIFRNGIFLSCSSSFSSKQQERDLLNDSSSSSSASSINKEGSSNLSELCNLLEVSSPNDYHKYLYLSGNNDNAINNNRNELLFQDIDDTTKTKEEIVERGLYIKCNIPKDEVIFQIPLSSCLTDDTPPKWLIPEKDNDEQYQHISNHPNHWATRLAASFLNIQEFDDEVFKGFHKWISLLPSPEQLRSSLPVHWNDNILSKARCYALEICVDSMYFTRADAVDVLLNGLKNISGGDGGGDTSTLLMEEKDLASRCHRALDIIQTRTCRVDYACKNDSTTISKSSSCIVTPIRILAPIFDFMNHGGSLNTNAYFQLEQQQNEELYLVVRALKDIKSNEELCIHYGENIKPAWKCLVSYGFVPDYGVLEDDSDNGEENEVAEVFLDGIRYEVGYSTIPSDMIHAMLLTIEMEMNHSGDGIIHDNDTAAKPIDSSNILQEYSPIIVSDACLRIAKRMSDVAFDLLLVNDDIDEEVNKNDGDVKGKLISLSLAAKLRYSQHKVLLACAMNLRDYANQIKGVSL